MLQLSVKDWSQATTKLQHRRRLCAGGQLARDALLLLMAGYLYLNMQVRGHVLPNVPIEICRPSTHNRYSIRIIDILLIDIMKLVS